MKRIVKFLPLGLLALGTSAFADGGNITMPTPDYTDFYAGVGVVLGVSLVFMIAKGIKHYFR